MSYNHALFLYGEENLRSSKYWEIYDECGNSSSTKSDDKEEGGPFKEDKILVRAMLALPTSIWFFSDQLQTGLKIDKGEFGPLGLMVVSKQVYDSMQKLDGGRYARCHRADSNANEESAPTDLFGEAAYKQLTEEFLRLKLSTALVARYWAGAVEVITELYHVSR